MPRYTDAYKLYENIAKSVNNPTIRNWLSCLIDEVPTADVAEVKHGEWISEIVEKEDWKGRKRKYFNPCSCSICHEPSPIRSNYNYCPHCGAKMGENDEHKM